MKANPTPTPDLAGPEIVLLLEALDSLIPGVEGTGLWMSVTEAERQRWEPYRILRRRLQEAVGMAYHANARGWLAEKMRLQRDATLRLLHGRLWELLAEPKMTRSALKAGMVSYMRELKDLES